MIAFMATIPAPRLLEPQQAFQAVAAFSNRFVAKISSAPSGCERLFEPPTHRRGAAGLCPAPKAAQEQLVLFKQLSRER